MWRSAASVLLFVAIARAFHARFQTSAPLRWSNSKGTASRLHSSKQQVWDDPDYKPPTQGQGEWADWDSDNFMGDMEPEAEEEVEGEDEGVAASRASAEVAQSAGRSFSDWKSGGAADGGLQGWDNLMKTAGSGGRSASENWVGWSEDAPYFDDNDILDEEPVKEGSVFKPLGSSDLWARPSASIADPAAPAAPAASVASVSAALPSAQSLPFTTGASTAGLEARVSALQGQVSDLKSMVALLLGLVAGYGLGSGTSSLY